MTTLPPPDTVDELVDALKQTAVSILGPECPLCAAFVDVVGPLVGFLYRRVAAGASPRAAVFAALLSEADSAAQVAEDAKFPPEKPTKP